MSTSQGPEIPESLVAHDKSPRVNALHADIKLLATSNDNLQTQVEQLKERTMSLHDALWSQHLKSPPSYSLFHAYELQRDVFLEIADVGKCASLSPEVFEQLWTFTKLVEDQHNLLCEMLVHGDLVLDDWSVLFYPIVDIGARALLYYVGLEKQLHSQQ